MTDIRTMVDSRSNANLAETVEILHLDVRGRGGVEGTFSNGHWPLPKNIADNIASGDTRELVMVDVHSNAMRPKYSQGDQVVLDRSQNEVAEGDYGMFVDDNFTIRSLTLADGGWNIEAENPSIKSVFIPHIEAARIDVVGRVVWISRFTF